MSHHRMPFGLPHRTPRRHAAAALCCLLASGCVQTQWQAAGSGPTRTLRTADETMDQELTDRVARLQRLASLQGITPPRIEQLAPAAPLSSGTTRAIPVIRVTFEERDFFASGATTPSAAAERVLHVIAENMRRDVPDVRVAVLGHTDATGSDRENMALSQSRALGVVRSLVAASVNPGQLSVVAIGGTQPVAPNASPDGRARNRRVEFLISPSEQANLAAVSRRFVNPAFLAASGPPVRSASRQVTVLKPSYAGPTDFSEAPLSPLASEVTLAAIGPQLDVGNNAETGSPVMAPVISGTVSGPVRATPPVAATVALSNDGPPAPSRP